MRRYISSLFFVFIFFGIALFSQDRVRKGKDSKRNVDQFKVNAYPVATEGDNIRLLVYGLIPYHSLQFLKYGDGFSAGYEASLGIRDKDGNQIDHKTFQSTVAVGDYVSTINRSSREVVMAEFIIKATEYMIVGELIDEDTRLKGIVREKIDMTGLLNPLAIYPPFIIGEYPGNWGFEENKIPVSTKDINHKIKEFPLFLSGRIKPGNFTMKVVAKDANKDIFWEDEIKLSSENTTFMRRILIDQKPDENLTMAIDVTITQENKSDSKAIELRIRKPGLSYFINNVDEALDQMRYVVTDEEYKRVKKAKRNEREKLFYQFWKDRDPSPGTVVNELMDQYYYRVSYTNEHFAAFDQGWKTDMGMIYILFGPPDDTQRSFVNSSRYTYETWYYYTINRNFTFYDENGFGEYKLSTPYYRGVGW
ncbi:MAG: GWxTD domain-containing protein [Candidatus Neomarinimicrobiota bacterium]